MSEDVRSVAAPAVLPAVGVAVVAAAVLAGAATAGAVPLLCAVAALQAAAGLAAVLGTDLPGRAGALVLAALAAAGADVAVALYPHARLQPVLPVVGLAIPALFLHQLQRRARRERVTAALGAIAVLVLVEIAPAALPQLRAEFQADGSGPAAVAAVVLAAGAAYVAGHLVDLVVPAPRFDDDVRRGFPGVLAAAGVGAAVGVAALRHVPSLSAASAAFAGAAVGVVTGLLSVAASFLAVGPGSRAAVVRGTLAAVVPLCLVAPVGLLVLLAVRA